MLLQPNRWRLYYRNVKYHLRREQERKIVWREQKKDDVEQRRVWKWISNGAGGLRRRVLRQGPEPRFPCNGWKRMNRTEPNRTKRNQTPGEGGRRETATWDAMTGHRRFRLGPGLFSPLPPCTRFRFRLPVEANGGKLLWKINDDENRTFVVWVCVLRRLKSTEFVYSNTVPVFFIFYSIFLPDRPLYTYIPPHLKGEILVILCHMWQQESRVSGR